MGFEVEVIQRLDKIERALSELRSGPFAGQKPGGFAQSGPVNEADVDAALAALGDLGSSFPGDAFVRGWLAKGYSVEQVVAAINGVLAPHIGKGGELNPGNPRAGAAYLATVAKDGGWAAQTRNHLLGRDPGLIVSPDSEANLLAGISTANGPADFDAIAAVVVERAERGVDWMGQRRFSDADLAEVKVILADPAKWRSEWKGWQDNSLLRVALLTKAIEAKWEGTNLFQEYSMPANLPVLKLNEYLFEQWTRIQTPAN